MDKVKVCCRCGKKISAGEWYCYRKAWSGIFGEPVKIERYCWNCASEMVDEHTHNHLLIAKDKEE